MHFQPSADQARKQLKAWIRAHAKTDAEAREVGLMVKALLDDALRQKAYELLAKAQKT